MVDGPPRSGAGIEIAFNNPSIEGDELLHLREAVEGGHSSAKGPFTERVAEVLREALGAEDVLLTTSCTAALEMAAMLLRIEPGDSVVVPSFTFVTTALAFARQGARLRFADIEPDTLGIDPDHVAALAAHADVRAVVPVHYAGVACDLAGLSAALADRDVDVVEDNAHGLFGQYRGRPLGSFGRMSTLSFHETKNFVCGEGGALALHRSDDVARAHVVLDKGTNRRAFMLGDVDKYSWVDDGSSFGLSDLLAAYLLGQLEARDTILAKRRAVFERYERGLRDDAEALGYRLPVIPADREQAYHMFYVLLPDRETRDAVLVDLHAAGFKATFHYVPLHDAPGATAHRIGDERLPVTDDVAGRLLRLPFFNELSLKDVDRIVDAFLAAVAARG